MPPAPYSKKRRRHTQGRTLRGVVDWGRPGRLHHPMRRRFGPPPGLNCLSPLRRRQIDRKEGFPMIKIAPSILSADFANLERDIHRISTADYVHVDVMDGVFVPNISIGIPVVQSIRKVTDMFLDVHLMIVEPERYIDEFVKCGADIITVHYEACKDLKATIQMIKDKGVKAGVTIKPNTPNSVLEDVLDQVDMILLMTVEPGFGGQSYIPSSTEKIRELRRMLDERGLKTDIEVDGGIKKNNLQMVLDAGANVIVAGSAIFEGDIEQNVKDFLSIMDK